MAAAGLDGLFLAARRPRHGKMAESHMIYERASISLVLLAAGGSRRRAHYGREYAPSPGLPLNKTSQHSATGLNTARRRFNSVFSRPKWWVLLPAFAHPPSARSRLSSPPAPGENRPADGGGGRGRGAGRAIILTVMSKEGQTLEEPTKGRTGPSQQYIIW